MAIEYPVLAMIAALMFVAIIFSTLYLYIYIVNEINKVPVVSGTAEAYAILNTVRIIIKVSHERGEPVQLQKIVMYINNESYAYTPQQLKLIGFENNTLSPGSTAYITTNITTTKTVETGQAIIHFDKGILTLKFTVYNLTQTT